MQFYGFQGGNAMRSVTQSCPTLCDPVDCSLPGSSVHGDSPGKNTGVGCHALLQGISPTQGSNPGLLHCRQILNHLSHHVHLIFPRCNHTVTLIFISTLVIMLLYLFTQTTCFHLVLNSSEKICLNQALHQLAAQQTRQHPGRYPSLTPHTLQQIQQISNWSYI